MRIVSNTGPIIGLAKIGKVGLLKSFAREVLIPPFVQKELFGKIGSETVHIENALDEFIRVMPADVSMPSTAGTLVELDEGERRPLRLLLPLERMSCC